MTRLRRVLGAAVRCSLASVSFAALAFIAVTGSNLEPDLRAWLSFDFAAPGARIHDAVAIAAQNFRLGAAPVLGIVAVTYARSSRPLADCVLALILVTNSVLVGSAIAAYRFELLSVLVPHGPLELAGFPLLGGAYLRARAGDHDVWSTLTATGLASGLLMLAAACEAGLWPR